MVEFRRIIVLAEAREIAEAHDLPVQTNAAEKSRPCDLIIVDVVDLEAAGIGVAQQHVAGVAAEEAAERDEPPIGPDLTERESAQNGVVADIVDFVCALAAAQNHVRRGARRRRRGWKREDRSATSGW